MPVNIVEMDGDDVIALSDSATEDGPVLAEFLRGGEVRPADARAEAPPPNPAPPAERLGLRGRRTNGGGVHYRKAMHVRSKIRQYWESIKGSPQTTRAKMQALREFAATLDTALIIHNLQQVEKWPLLAEHDNAMRKRFRDQGMDPVEHLEQRIEEARDMAQNDAQPQQPKSKRPVGRPTTLSRLPPPAAGTYRDVRQWFAPRQDLASQPSPH